jgi:trimeric autotransporter adhesin
MSTRTYTASKDAMMGKQIVGGSFSGWNGKDDHLPVGVSQSGNYKFRSNVYFSVSFSGMDAITDARLYLYSHTTGTNLHCIQTSSPSTLVARRCTADWGEGISDPGEGNLTGTEDWDWDNRASSVTSSGMNSKSITQGGNGTEESIDVTDIVTAWFNGSNNYGIQIKEDNETASSKGMQFYSRHYGTSSDRPKLVITYTTNTAPNAPTGLAPSNNTVISLAPSLSGTRSDPDSGDAITAAQLKVYGPSALYRWSTSTTASDPGSGYIRVSAGGGTIYASETDKNGATVTTALTSMVAGSNTLYVVARTDPARWKKIWGLDTRTDNGTWDTLSGDDGSSSSGSLTANEDVFLVADIASALYWDSAGVTIKGNPTSFSVPYGSQGDAIPIAGNTCYIWTAKTKDIGGLWGPFASPVVFKANSTPATPTVTILSSPANDINDDTPSFSITHNDSDVDDQLMYAYQVIVEKESSGSWSTTGGWDSGSISTSGAPVATVQVDSSALAFGGHYRVKARTQDSSGTYSSYSPAWEFYTHKAAVPTSLAPSGGALTSLSPVFTGNAASTSDVITAYTIAVYTADLGTTMLAPTRYTTGIVGGGTGFSKAYAGSTLVASASYVWTVFIETASGDTSATSSNQAFTVSDATVPALTAPLGDNAYSLTPTITGSRTSTFNRFKYEVYPSTSTDSNLGTVIYASASLSATISGSNPTTFSTVYGGSPALTFGTTYRIRCAVSPDAGSNWSSWSGLQSFSTDSAAVGSPNSPADNAWITTATPAFYINRGGSDTIDQMQVRVWNAQDTAIIWDSGMTDVTNGTTNVGPITYAGQTLVPGTTYHWDFRYQKTGGAVGGYSSKYSFRLNGPPLVPSNLYPTPGATFADTLLPTFRATYYDPEQATHSDLPTKWSIRILDSGGSTLVTKEITTDLVAGQNQYFWQTGDYTLSYSTDYSWQTWYTDTKSAVGSVSTASAFRMGVSPNGTITVPSSGNINDSSPDVTWTFSGGTQSKYRIRVYETDSFGVRTSSSYKYQTSGVNGWVTSASTTFTIPSGQLVNTKYYDIQLEVQNTDNLVDPTPSVVNIHTAYEAPDPIVGLSVTTFAEQSKVQLDWDAWATQSGHSFKWYGIERRLVGDEDFTLVDKVISQSTSKYTDWYAAHDVDYQYRVTVTTLKTGNENYLESPDDPDGGNLATAKLSADVWMFIGYDRADEHVQELFVTDEDHNRPVQQESFETLGSDRKVIIRGFVLGNEGNITVVYSGHKLVASPTDEQVFYEETVLGRRLIDYLTFNKGPHILKSPFGDVWDAEFAGPEYRWSHGGNLEVQLSWIETGQTSAGRSI